MRKRVRELEIITSEPLEVMGIIQKLSMPDI